MPFNQPTPISIVPKRFLPWITGQEAGSPLFFNRQNADGSGFENVYQEFLAGGDVPLPGMALFSGDTGELFLDGCEIEYFLGWFNAHRGKFHSFQFRYWGDYQCTAIPLLNCLDDSMATQGVTWPLTGDGNNGAFRLLKSYANGSEISYRRIRAPVLDTLEVYVDGVLTPVVLLSDGVINFSTAPGVGLPITHSCDFDIIVRFDTDQFAIETISNTGEAETYKLGALSIVELAMPSPILLRAEIC
jgi:uncharacterized protein (TIGR02217 family)